MSVAGKIATVGILGTGAMGRGIAQIAAQAGRTVVLVDAADGAAEKAKAFVAGMFDRAVEKGRMSRDDADAAAGRLTIGAGIADFAGCDLVVEAIVEDLEVKKRVFRDLEGAVAPGCILATNTSSLPVTAIAAAVDRPERVAGYHFFNPVPLMKVVEVIAGARTDPAVCDALAALADEMGHYPARVTDAPGFLINHAGRGYTTEGLAVLAERVADAPAIDAIMREAAGFPLGPFELLDLTGVDVSDPVMRSIYHQFYEEPRFRPQPETATRLAAGLFGRKSGEGFYRYPDGKKEAVAEPAVTAKPPPVIWVHAERAEDGAALLAALEKTGVAVETKDAPSDEALALLLLYGEDVSSAVTRLGLAPDRVVGIDPLLGFEKRVTVMGCPATDTAAVEEARALFAAAGLPATAIADSNGFVAQRILAMVVNTACEIAQKGIADPADIDQAVRRGLGYPTGPLTWGDQLGADRVLTILTAIHAATGDPRYRPGLWLRRRVQLGLPLTAPARAIQL